jgi:feruloyl-CoA synthase
MERRPDGTILVEPQMELGEYPERLTDRLDQWAAEAPGRTFLAERDGSGPWRRISYAEFRRKARAAAQWLLAGGFNVERPLAILSGNDIEHAILAVGAMYAGIPYTPVAPPYSLMSSDFGRLRQVFELLTPGLVFASDGGQFARAIEAVVPRNATVVVTRNPQTRGTVEFAELVEDCLEAALPAVNADSVAKVLFTSGSTDVPKGVITTHRMLASNQEMLRRVFPFFAEEPLAICDWLPWNHTFGGSHNFGLILYNGGTMYLDGGCPVEGRFEQSVANLREIAPTVYFNVPKGYEMLARYLREDEALRQRFFCRLQMMFYAGAGLSQQVWNELEQFARETRGERIPMLTGLGSTETAPFAMCASAENMSAGVVGLPVPGVRLKLAPVGEKLEARVKGPNVTPGYWRQPALTAAAFDDEGYYRMGDGLRFVDVSDVRRGFLFDGRLAEDFKLSTGTWVSVGPLRTRFLLHCAPYLRDVVIAGSDRDDVTALIFPDLEHYCQLEAAGKARDTFERLLGSFAASNPGSSTRIERAVVVTEPPSLDDGELTDKGTVRQAAVLRRRADVVERMYAPPYGADVILAAAAKTVPAGQEGRGERQ